MEINRHKVFSCALILILLLIPVWAIGARNSKVVAQSKKSPSTYEKVHTAEIESYLAKAKKYYEMAEFTFAQVFYDRALRLDKQNAAIKAKIEECKRLRVRQKELLLAAPKGEKRSPFLKSKYNAAISLYKQEQYNAAKKEFEEIWLIAGEYKKTKKYLRNIREKIDEKTRKPKPIPKPETKPEKEKKKQEAAVREAKIKTLLSDGKKYLKKKQYDAAINKFNEALSIDRENKKARKFLKKAQEEKADTLARAKAEDERKRKAELKKKKELEAKKAAEAKRQAELVKERKEKETAKARAKAEDERKRKAEPKKKKELEAKKAAEAKRQAELVKERKEKETVRARAKAEEERKRKTELKKKKELEAKGEAEQIRKLQKEKLRKAEALTKEGKKLLKKGKFDKAIEKAEAALKIQPLYAEASKLKKEATEKKNARKATGERRIAAERDAKAKREKAARRIAEGKKLLDTGNYDAAALKFQEALRLNPKDPEPKKLLDEVAQAKQKTTKEKANALVAEGRLLLAKNRFSEARAKFQDALALDRMNTDASRGLQEVARKEAESRRMTQEAARQQKVDQSKRLFEQGLKAYEKKDIETAAAKWKEALRVDPNNLKASTYLEETKRELEVYRKGRAEKEAFEKREADARAKMNTLISVSTTVPHTPLISYLDSLSLVSGINFYVSSGVEATVDAKFVDTPLHVVLDTLFIPIGLKWSRKPGTDIVTIAPDLYTKIFNLTPEEAVKVKAVMDNGHLQKILWGKDAVPKMKGVELTLDEREGLLISVDSKTNQDKIAAFLKDLKTQAPPGLIFRTYRLREGEGPKVKSLLEAILKADSRAPYAPERKLLLDGRDLIIKDTPENIRKVEVLLQDKGFIEKIRSENLQVQTWVLVPKEAMKANPEQMRAFGEWVVEVIKVMLYAKSTVSKAEAEGRRLWWDPATMQLTLTDYPDNTLAVSDFIHSLPQLEQKAKTKIIPLKYAKASEIATRVNAFLGITAPAEAGVPGGMTVTRSLGVGNDFTFRDLTIRLTRVNENDQNDEYDDSIELKVRTPGESRDITMDEFDSETIDDYDVIAEDVKPSSTPGEGRVRLKVNYLPPVGMVPVVPTPGPTPAVTEVGEKPVQEIKEINAIFVEYKDPTYLAQVEEWIKRLDVRKQQVSIETKFVEVIESRAKEFSSQFAIADLTEGIDFSDSVLNMRFANDLDELQNAIRSQYEPPAESPYFQHLLKGTTVFSLITGGKSPINWQLRLLEAEGVVNVVNGPHIVVENGESADFRITRILGGIPQVDASGNYIGGQGVQSYTPVDISLSEVFVTQLGDIELDIDATVEDMDALTGGAVTAPTTTVGADLPAAGNVQYTLSRLTKDFTTKAHIKDGGTIVLGGWTNERSGDYKSGVPIIHDIPFIGKLLFGRNLRHIDKTTLLIFLTGRIIE